MTLAESSFNAWIKLYRQTKDSPYSQTSYYAKGALAAFLISDALEQRSNGEFPGPEPAGHRSGPTPGLYQPKQRNGGNGLLSLPGGVRA